MPQFSYREVAKRLKKAGFVLDRYAKGSHEIWFNESNGKVVLVPHHANKSLATGTVLNIAKTAGFKNLKEFQDFS